MINGAEEITMHANTITEKFLTTMPLKMANEESIDPEHIILQDISHVVTKEHPGKFWLNSCLSNFVWSTSSQIMYATFRHQRVLSLVVQLLV